MKLTDQQMLNEVVCVRTEKVLGDANMGAITAIARMIATTAAAPRDTRMRTILRRPPGGGIEACPLPQAVQTCNHLIRGLENLAL